MSNVTIDTLLTAVVDALKASTAITDLLGVQPNTDPSIMRWSKGNDPFQMLMRNPSVVCPALIVSWQGGNWENQGQIHDRNIKFQIMVVVKDRDGFLAREATAIEIIDTIHAVIIDSELGLSNVENTLPISEDYYNDLFDRDNQPLEISMWNMLYETGTAWQ